ncbi:hypothetical protein PR048_002527 [Dryococelus australis]|uniref:Uncharacterized protein n=1 Tax=Dryococelus australis TaxID=614101 RepID=A0ABQ9IKF7_9NEOP|nr:hypothetical protein PR048_002527 [Dryococelus australis]
MFNPHYTPPSTFRLLKSVDKFLQHTVQPADKLSTAQQGALDVLGHIHLRYVNLEELFVHGILLGAQRDVPLAVEHPRPRCEVLQHVQPVVDLPLDPHHAATTKKKKKPRPYPTLSPPYPLPSSWLLPPSQVLLPAPTHFQQDCGQVTNMRKETASRIQPSTRYKVLFTKTPANETFPVSGYLQWLLKEDNHEEINEVGRYPLKEENGESVHKLAAVDVTVWIPNNHLEWVLVDEVPSHVQYIKPSNGSTSHMARVSMTALRELLPDRVVSLHADIRWPARSPDLSPCNLFLWKHLKRSAGLGVGALLPTKCAVFPDRSAAAFCERRGRVTVDMIYFNNPDISGEQSWPWEHGIVRHDSHMRKSGVTRPGIESGSPWWEASRLTAEPPRSRTILQFPYFNTRVTLGELQILLRRRRKIVFVAFLARKVSYYLSLATRV